MNDTFIRTDCGVASGGTKACLTVHYGRSMVRSPATMTDPHIKSDKALRRGPRHFRDVAALKNAVFKFEPND